MIGPSANYGNNHCGLKWTQFDRLQTWKQTHMPWIVQVHCFMQTSSPSVAIPWILPDYNTKTILSKKRFLTSNSLLVGLLPSKQSHTIKFCIKHWQHMIWTINLTYKNFHPHPYHLVFHNILKHQNLYWI